MKKANGITDTTPEGVAWTDGEKFMMIQELRRMKAEGLQKKTLRNRYRNEIISKYI